MMHRRTYSLLVLIMCFLLAACNLPAAVSAEPPATPEYSNFVLDCRTADAEQTFVQPPAGCDRWQDNRYERPFNAQAQDTYYPDLDIVFSALGESGGWFFTRIALQSLRPGTQVPTGSYGVEIDTDQDRRGDYLIAGTPQVNASQDWSPAAVQAWYDSDNDVGNQEPGQPDGPYLGNGYNQLITGQDSGKNPNAFMRVRERDGHVYLELAFKAVLIGSPQSFDWWTWADEGVRKLNGFDYQDTFDLPVAGEVYMGSQYFPARSIAAVDDTCADTFGGDSPQGEAYFCRGDPAVAYVPAGDMCEDPIIQGDVIVCVPSTSGTLTVTPTCPPNTISFNSPTPGGPTPCGGHPPCVQLVIGNNTPDPSRCTPTATPGFGTGTPASDCPTPALVRGPANTPTPGGPTPCYNWPPCLSLHRAGEPSPTPGACTPTPTCPPASLSTNNATPCIPLTPCASLNNSAAAASTAGCTPTATPQSACPTLSFSRDPVNTATPGGPTPCFSFPPCTHLSRAGAPTATPGGCTPTPTCPPAAFSNSSASPCVPSTPCASLNNSAGAANTAGCTPTPTPTCPANSLSSSAAAASPGGCPTATQPHITFTPKPTRRPRPTQKPNPTATEVPIP